MATGLAKAIYDEYINNYLADTGFPLPPGADGAPIKKGFAIQANRVATAMVTYFVANTQVTTTVATAIPVQVTIPSGTGATTAPGSGTGTIA